MNTLATPAQLRFFLLDQQGGRATVVQQITLDGPVDSDRLAEVIRDVCHAHPALRTSLHLTPDGLTQRTHPVSEIDITVAHLAPGAAGPALAEHLPLVGAPFAHGAGPLCRVRVLHTPERTHCLFGVHHAVFDDDSAHILLRDLAAAYHRPPQEPQPSRRPSVQPPEPQRASALRNFWATALDGHPQDTSLPHFGTADRETRDAGGRAGVVTVPVGSVLGDAMRRRTHECGATPFAQLLAAVATTIGWYSDTDDVVLATVTGGRTGATQDDIGCFQNTLPIRLRLADRDTAQFLDHTLDQLFDAVDHADLPIEDILTAAQVARRPGRKPLTQILCAQTSAQAPLESGELLWRLTTPPAEEREYPLAVTLHHAADGSLHLVIDHDTERLTPHQAHRLAAHLLRALHALAEGPARPLTGLRLLEAEDLTTRPGPSDEAGTSRSLLVHESLARHDPRAIAIRTASEELSYADLDRRVTGLAAALIGAGVLPGDRVGIRLPRTPALVTAMLAVWKAGAAYVPLDPEYPADRLRYMADDAVLSAVIGDGGVTLSVPVLPAEAEAPSPATWPTSAPGDPAYLIYTSGTTGRPKGVVIRHENLTALFAALRAELGGAPAVTVAATSMSFDVSGLETHWPIAEGRTLFLTGHRTVAAEPIPDGALYQCTPTVARILTSTPAGRSLLGRLGTLLVGGEPLPADLATELTAHVPGPVLNCYGPTETTIWSTMWRVVPSVPVRIGHPLLGEECHVVDTHGRPLPAGCPGRLLISGHGVGDGYWRRPDLTAERFAPLNGADGQRAYDTGDLAVLDPVHGLRFIGRADTQVKVLGQRIELEEIETALRAHPRVLDAVATVSAADDATIAACLVLSPVPGAADNGSAATAPPELADELRAFAGNWLTGAMVPSVWLLAARLPQLPNGKLDRPAVAAWAAAAEPPAAGPSGHPADEQEPVTDTRKLVRQVWERVLPVPVTDIDAGFFELGGTSSGVLRVLAVLRTTHPALHTADLFRHTTIRTLALHLDEVLVGAQRATAAPKASRGAVRAQALTSWPRRTRRAH